jgi:hypothetical protein
VIEQFTMRRQAGTARAGQAEQDRMRLIVRMVLYLVLVAAIGLLALAVFSDLPAPQREVEIPVDPK